MSRRDPDEVTSVLVRTMRERGRAVRVIDMPGVDGARVALWAPTEQDEVLADVAARKRLRAHYKLDAVELSIAQESALHKREREAELLATLLRDADDPEQAAFESADQVREMLSPVQRRRLIEAIEDFQHERFESRTPEGQAELVEAIRGLKAGGALSDYWRSCGFDTQLSIVNALLEASTKPTEPSSSST